MTDSMLDQMLAMASEPEPADDGFVRMVMVDVKKEEQRRWRMKLVRRPVVFGVAAAVIATGGAVAALVGTHGTPKSVEASSAPRHASVTVTLPHASAPASPVKVPAGSVSAAPASPGAAQAIGHFTTPHTSWAMDDRTGLRLTTDTYSNSFKAGVPQKVTLTILNTSPRAVTVSGSNGCALQVIASQGGAAGTPVCASTLLSGKDLVLPPGGFATATASVTLPSAGTWSIVGACSCTVSQTVKTNIPQSGDLTGALTGRTGQLPVLPVESNAPAAKVQLATPAISVTAS